MKVFRLSLLLFAVGSLLCAGATREALAGPARADVARNDSVAAILHQVSREGVLRGLKWPRFSPYKDELQTLYSGSDWRPVWSAKGRPSGAARTAIRVLLTAEERGLHPEDYDSALLDRCARELSTARSAPAHDIAWFDVALSVGFMRHLSDVRIGRINPEHLSVGIDVRPKKLDLAQTLRDALARDRIAEAVRDAEPKLVQYRNLKTAYARYRALAESPAPPPVVARAVVRPGGRFDGAPALRRRLAMIGDLSAAGASSSSDSALYDTTTVAAVKRFQERHGLAPDGVIGAATLSAINVPLATRKRQLELAMERIRWLPEISTGPFVIVNVPSFVLYGFDTLNTSGRPALTMNVVVGRDQMGRQTPIFHRDMRYIVFRPYWVVPYGILKKETLPAARRDPGYLTRNEMEIYSGSGDYGPAEPTTADNLDRVARGELGIRQRPGPKNSLGLAKFIFPNDHNVFLHGTPATELFSRSRRDFSHGCIRLEDPARLAVWILRDPTRWSVADVQRAMQGVRPQRVNLTRPLPVVIYYTTAAVRPDGVVAFYEDVYGRDAKLERALAQGYPYPR